MTLAVFDVCDTLFSVNTTNGFLSWYANELKRPQLARLVEQWSTRSSPFFLAAAISHRLLGLDIARQRMILGLKGELRLGLETAAAHFVEHLLAEQVNRPVMDRLDDHRARSHRILLASSSLDLVIQPIAERLGVEFIASRLGFKGNACTGTLDIDRTGRKSYAVSQIRAEGEEMFVYSDNRSDATLLREADHPFVVWPRRGRPERWLGDEAEYVRL